MIKPPRDFYAAIFVLFWETYSYYLFSYLLMVYCIEEVGMGNVNSGFIYGAFGGVILIQTVALGWLIDKILLRKTLLLNLSVSTISMVMFAASSNVYWTCGIMFGPLAFSLAIGLPSLPVAVSFAPPILTPL